MAGTICNIVYCLFCLFLLICQFYMYLFILQFVYIIQLFDLCISETEKVVSFGAIEAGALNQIIFHLCVTYQSATKSLVHCLWFWLVFLLKH